VTRRLLTDIADQFRDWITQRARKWVAPILNAPEGRRDDFVDSYFRRAKANEVVVILKAREPARILTANGNAQDDRWYLEIKQRWDAHWGRLFVRICPYFPFSARVCLNQHHWLANRMRQDGIDFRPCSNAFLQCGNPQRLELRAKHVVEKVPHSRRYRLRPEGYSICLVFLKLFERIYAPLTAGLLQPVSGDSRLQQQKRTELDRLYQRVVDDLDQLVQAVGLKAA